MPVGPSSCGMSVTVMAPGSPAGSVTPTTETPTNLCFGGQRTAGAAAAALQSGRTFPGIVVVVGGCVLVVVVGIGGCVVVVVLLAVVDVLLVVEVVVDGVVVVGG